MLEIRSVLTNKLKFKLIFNNVANGEMFYCKIIINVNGVIREYVMEGIDRNNNGSCN